MQKSELHGTAHLLTLQQDAVADRKNTDSSDTLIVCNQLQFFPYDSPSHCASAVSLKWTGVPTSRGCWEIRWLNTFKVLRKSLPRNNQ